MSALNRNPKNLSPFQSTKFRLTFARLPEMTYFCQTANFPGVSLNEVPRNTPFVDYYVPGEKLQYDTLNISFMVEEDFYSWTTIHDWIRGMTFPTNFEEYINLARLKPEAQLNASARNSGRVQPQYSQATLTLYTNQNNPNIRIKLYDVFPVTLSTILLSTQDTAENIVTADAAFRFSYYDYERLG